MLSLLPCFNPLYFLKGTSFALLVSCQIQTLAFPWSNSVVPKSGVLFTGSLFCSPKSLEYITRCCIRQRYRQRTQCVSRVSSTFTIAITFYGGIHVDLVGSGKGAKSLEPTREEAWICRDGVGGWGWAGVGGSHLGRMRFDLLCVTVNWIHRRGLQALTEGLHVADVSRLKCRWVSEVDRGVCCWLVGCRQEVEESRSHALEPSERQVIPRFALQLSPFVLRLVGLRRGYM